MARRPSHVGVALASLAFALSLAHARGAAQPTLAETPITVRTRLTVASGLDGPAFSPAATTVASWRGELDVIVIPALVIGASWGSAETASPPSAGRAAFGGSPFGNVELTAAARLSDAGLRAEIGGFATVPTRLEGNLLDPDSIARLRWLLSAGLRDSWLILPATGAVGARARLRYLCQALVLFASADLFVTYATQAAGGAALTVQLDGGAAARVAWFEAGAGIGLVAGGVGPAGALLPYLQADLDWYLVRLGAQLPFARGIPSFWETGGSWTGWLEVVARVR